MQYFQGKSVYKGIVMGPVAVLKKNDYQVKRARIEDPEAEVKRVKEAVEVSKKQLGRLYDKAVREVGEASAAIFEVHQMMLEDEDYLEAIQSMIRTEQVSMMTSDTSKYPVVREKLLSLQRGLAEKENVIMDGRDIGTCVLPNADVKIYLTASAAERARRRYKEQTERGVDCDIKEIERDIIARDEQDMNREVAPLRQAEDAVLVDSSDMTIDQVVDEIIRIYQEKTV